MSIKYNLMILIGVHAFTSDPDYTKTREKVTKDRVEKTYDVAKEYNKLCHKDNIKVVYLGCSKTENELSCEYTKRIADKYTDTNDIYETILCNQYGGNTENEVKSFIKLADELDPNIIISVSSMDHTPRIQKIYSQYYDKSYIINVCSSESRYTKYEKDPFILEGRYPEIIDSLSEIPSLPHSKDQELSEDIQDLISRYKT